MNVPHQRMVGNARVSRHAPVSRDPRLLGRILRDMGAINEDGLTHALSLQRRYDVPLGEIFVAEGMINGRQLRGALAQQYGVSDADLLRHPPDPELHDLMDVETCLELSAVPWRKIGPFLVVATAHPSRIDQLSEVELRHDLIVLPAVAEVEAVRHATARLYGPVLAQRAQERVAEMWSCRAWGNMDLRRWAIAGFMVVLLAVSAFLAPLFVMQGLAVLALVTLFLSTLLKASAAAFQLWHETRPEASQATATVTPMRLPKVSVMVPLLREKEIADALIERLSRLTYPKPLLDVMLVLEEHDDVTRDTLARTLLPPWIRVIEVPSGGGLTTKPRALNYALDFCQGSIVGIWDAEDAPAHDQIEQVVTRFNAARSDVVCLQGQLDYYNPRTNWISRCFTIEYAAWWRLVMPGLARLGLVIPLGGTTLFFRRKELHALGGWDAHNVTEDADLGLRLARAGYRTELIPTVTHEEANCRAWPWIRQRSRWLKGFALTWAVHMRDPLQLWRDLGTYRFLGLQVFFITALSQFLLAPVLWCFWALSFGVSLPFGNWDAVPGILGFFLGCELVTLGIHAAAVRRAEHRHLLVWTPLMMLYFPMGCIAMYKAVYELIVRPFFWDKTQHASFMLLRVAILHPAEAGS